MLCDVVSMGGLGGICVASHLVGARMAQVARLAAQGRIDEARVLDAQLASLYKALFATTNPILVKAALDLMGRDVGKLRPPLVPASDEERAALRTELEHQGLL
jgi:4-hydroxy-tetrahydrodipicolinate synthase